MEGQGGFIFEHKAEGPGGWAVIGLGWLVSGALFIFALAIFALANWVGAALASLVQYVGIGVLMIAGGQCAFRTFQGVAMIVDARGRARALEKEAEGRYVAAVRAARLSPPAAPQPSSPWREVSRWEDGRRD